jgi:hypothetical protein
MLLNWVRPKSPYLDDEVLNSYTILVDTKIYTRSLNRVKLDAFRKCPTPGALPPPTRAGRSNEEHETEEFCELCLEVSAPFGILISRR